MGAMLASGTVSLAASDSQLLFEMLRSAALLLLGISAGSSIQRERLMQPRHALPVAIVAILTFVAIGTCLLTLAIGADVAHGVVVPPQ